MVPGNTILVALVCCMHPEHEGRSLQMDLPIRFPESETPSPPKFPTELRASKAGLYYNTNYGANNLKPKKAQSGREQMKIGL